MNKFTFVACLILGIGNSLWAQYDAAARRAADQTTASAIDAAPVDLKQNLAATVNVINQRLTDVTRLPLGKRTPQAILRPFEETRMYLRQLDALSSALVQNHSDNGLVSLGKHYKEWAQALEARIFNDPVYERLQKSADENSTLPLLDHARLTNYFNEIRRQASASSISRTGVANSNLPEKVLAQARELFGEENAKKLEVLPRSVVEFVTQPHADSDKILGSAANMGMFKKTLPLLPPRELQIFTLRYIQGLGPNEISRQLGISPNTSNGALNAARKRLKGLLSIGHLSVHAAAEPNQAMTEKEAIAAAQKGDEKSLTNAIGFLFEKHTKRVYRVILRIVGNTEDAEDLTQDVFFKLPEKIKKFRGDSAFSTWLHRVAVNTALMKLRRKSLPIAYSLDEPAADAGGEINADAATRGYLAADADISNNPEIIAIRNEQKLELHEALDKLPPNQRKVLILHDYEGYKHNEIAKMLDISVGTSKSQLARARQRMRELLRPDSDAHDGDTIEVVPSEVSEPALAAP